jgi:uncharacterized Zn-finger protein
MDFKRLFTSQWLNRIILIIIMITAGAVLFTIDQIDKIVNVELYKYHLQFDTAWAEPYWSSAKITYYISGIIIALAALGLAFDFLRGRKRIPEISNAPEIKYKQSAQIQTEPPEIHNKQPPKMQVQPKTVPKPQAVTIQEQKPKETTPKITISSAPKEKATSANAPNSCPNCQKTFTRPLVMLNFEGGKSKLVNVCPYCNEVLGDAEEQDR